ncbi:hypothetical protein LTR36_002795 [Oleoguttula mirabilis]|uniref:SAP domain-containing protein n=1 Tax=Oleoguttula mirabilis TaxID=1507867 RepID=A0AAV9JLR2_9PEZI|nr:hypothetical protein LTR36_002795 [Oleoguttula mirabilis]
MDYSKKKNDELVTLLKERGLPHTGKKADFVKRLEEYDSAQSTSTTTTTAPPVTKPALEDEIDWDDEPATETAGTATTTTEPAADAIAAAGGIGEVANPVAVPNQTLVEDPATTNDLTVAAAPTTAETEPTTTATANDGDAKAVQQEKEASPEKDYSQGIAARAIDEELEKRKARAIRFGLPDDSDEMKLLARAKRFGTSNESSAVPGLLNQALSQGRKRDRENAGTGEVASGVEDGGVRKRNKGGRGGRNGRGGGRPGLGGGRQGSERERARGGDRDRAVPAKKAENGNGNGNGPSWMNDADRQKMDARKARFGVPS